MNSINSIDGRVKQKASEMWCLMRVLPLMLGDKIPEDDHWELLISLCEIDGSGICTSFIK